jgi:hypothetical protein
MSKRKVKTDKLDIAIRRARIFNPSGKRWRIFKASRYHLEKEVGPVSTWYAYTKILPAVLRLFSKR